MELDEAENRIVALEKAEQKWRHWKIPPPSVLGQGPRTLMDAGLLNGMGTARAHAQGESPRVLGQGPRLSRADGPWGLKNKYKVLKKGIKNK